MQTARVILEGVSPMKAYLLAAAAMTASLGFGASAMAAGSLTGMVTLDGSVPAQCSVSTDVPGLLLFQTTVNLGDIADTDGHLVSSLASSTNASAPVATFQVNCTGAHNTATLQATALAISPAPAAQTGYSSSVAYTAEADYAAVGGQVTQTQTSDGVTSSPTAAFQFANQSGNLAIKAYAFNDGNNTVNILDAGAYEGVITVVITPGA